MVFGSSVGEANELQGLDSCRGGVAGPRPLPRNPGSGPCHRSLGAPKAAGLCSGAMERKRGLHSPRPPASRSQAFGGAWEVREVAGCGHA